MRTSTLALAGFLAVVASACSDAAPTAVPGSPAIPDAASSSNSIASTDDTIAPSVVMRMNGTEVALARGGQTGGGTPSPTGIDFHGGPVLGAGTNVTAIYWAAQPIFTSGPTPGTTGAGATDASLVGFFLGHLGGSAYFNINHSYCAVACVDGNAQPIANIVNYTRYWANNSNVPSNGQVVSNSQMLSMIESGIASGAIAYDPATIYLIFTAGTVNLGGGFGTSYCAYHSWGTVTISHKKLPVLFAALPYSASYPGVCTAGAGTLVDSVAVGWTPANGDIGADAQVNVIAHEVEETTTDMNGSAWRAANGQENADKCVWGFGGKFRLTYFTPSGGVANMKIGGKDFLIQMNWANWGTGGCAVAYPGVAYQ